MKLTLTLSEYYALAQKAPPITVERQLPKEKYEDGKKDEELLVDDTNDANTNGIQKLEENEESNTLLVGNEHCTKPFSKP
jgi:hypothetical protein